jgi:flagellar protein FliO/FliZ
LVPVLVFFPLLVMAGDPPVPAVIASPLASALQMLFGLGVVLAAIAGTAWLLRRMSPGQIGIASNLRVVAAVAVGPKERVVLVDIGEQRLVLGVAPGQVVRLAEMPRPDDEVAPHSVPVSSPFMAKLKEFLAARGVGQ